MVQLRKNLNVRQLAEWSKRIIYADSAVIVVNKPSGLICQSNHNLDKGIGQFDLLLHATKTRLGLETLPFQLHRLDKLTTGALLLATNARHVKTLAAQFREHEVRKSYLAIVRGGRQSFEHNIATPLVAGDGAVRRGTIDTRLSLEEGRVRVDDVNGTMALTGWELLGSSEKVPLSLLRLSLLTGHKHQLRIHLAETLGCPILGDTLYSKRPPTQEIMDIIPKHISIGHYEDSRKSDREVHREERPRRTSLDEERIFLHSAQISMTRYQSLGVRHKKAQLSVTAPLPSDFLEICTAAGLRGAIPEAYVTGAVEVNGVQVPLDREVEGLKGRWLGDSEDA